MIPGMNFSKPDSSSSQPQKNSTRTCMRSHYSTCTKPHPNPNRRRKSGSERRKRNPTDQTNMEGRNPPTYLGATRKRSSRITVRPWPVSPRLRLTSTKQIKHPAGTVDVIATIP
jgi:hypothetical protein